MKLCDFGVSGELINSVAGTFTGTSLYMAVGAFVPGPADAPLIPRDSEHSRNACPGSSIRFDQTCGPQAFRSLSL